MVSIGVTPKRSVSSPQLNNQSPPKNVQSSNISHQASVQKIPENVGEAFSQVQDQVGAQYRVHQGQLDPSVLMSILKKIVNACLGKGAGYMFIEKLTEKDDPCITGGDLLPTWENFKSTWDQVQQAQKAARRAELSENLAKIGTQVPDNVSKGQGRDFFSSAAMFGWISKKNYVTFSMYSMNAQKMDDFFSVLTPLRKIPEFSTWIKSFEFPAEPSLEDKASGLLGGIEKEDIQKKVNDIPEEVCSYISQMADAYWKALRISEEYQGKTSDLPDIEKVVKRDIVRAILSTASRFDILGEEAPIASNNFREAFSVLTRGEYYDLGGTSDEKEKNFVQSLCFGEKNPSHKLEESSLNHLYGTSGAVFQYESRVAKYFDLILERGSQEQNESLGE